MVYIVWFISLIWFTPSRFRFTLCVTFTCFCYLCRWRPHHTESGGRQVNSIHQHTYLYRNAHLLRHRGRCVFFPLRHGTAKSPHKFLTESIVVYTISIPSLYHLYKAIELVCFWYMDCMGLSRMHLLVCTSVLRWFVGSMACRLEYLSDHAQ